MRIAIILARMLSTVFRPAYYPIVGFVILFTLTYMVAFAWQYKLWVLGMLTLFTLLLPMLGTYIYRKLNGWSRHELRSQHRRAVPYLIYLCCCVCCMHVMNMVHLPRFMTAILGSSLLIQTVCILVNMKWKVSVHSAGCGGIIGVLVAYAQLLGFNPLWWLCATILLSGLVMTSRMLLRQHTLWQVLGGTLLGVICGYIGIILM